MKKKNLGVKRENNFKYVIISVFAPFPLNPAINKINRRKINEN